MGGEAFKRKLVHSVAVAIPAWNNIVGLLKSFIANVLKWKAFLKTKFKCRYVAMCFLVMRLFSGDLMKEKID